MSILLLWVSICHGGWLWPVKCFTSNSVAPSSRPFLFLAGMPVSRSCSCLLLSCKLLDLLCVIFNSSRSWIASATAESVLGSKAAKKHTCLLLYERVCITHTWAVLLDWEHVWWNATILYAAVDRGWATLQDELLYLAGYTHTKLNRISSESQPPAGSGKRRSIAYTRTFRSATALAILLPLLHGATCVLVLSWCSSSLKGATLCSDEGSAVLTRMPSTQSAYSHCSCL